MVWNGNSLHDRYLIKLGNMDINFWCKFEVYCQEKNCLEIAKYWKDPLLMNWTATEWYWLIHLRKLRIYYMNVAITRISCCLARISLENNFLGIERNYREDLFAWYLFSAGILWINKTIIKLTWHVRNFGSWIEKNGDELELANKEHFLVV